MEKIKVFEAFAGYGGASFGLDNAGIEYTTIGYSEIHKDAIAMYELNFPNVPNYGDITAIDPTTLPDFDLFTGGFPCQPFSNLGLQNGEADTRGVLFYDIIRILKVKQPKYLLLENVRGFLSAKFKPTLDKIITALQSIGYDVRYQLLNSKDYGVPQNRERVWIFGYLGKLPEGFTLAPPKEKLTTFFTDLLDPKPASSLYKNQTQIARLQKRMPKVNYNVTSICPLDVYSRKVKTDNICPTLIEVRHDNLNVIEPPINGMYQIRKLSINEQYRFMGFKDGQIKLPPLSYNKLGNRCGNGWEVNLVGKLLKHISSQV